MDTADFSDATAGVTITLNGDTLGTAVFTDTTNNDDLYSIENLLGTQYADRITVTDLNANWIDGGAGADTILAGAGDDTLIYDAADATVDGEAGTDTLMVRDAALDLTAAGISGTQIKNIEVIDLRGSQGTKLTLSVASVAAVSSSSDALTVYADDQDVLELVGTWALGANTVVGNSVYRNWTGTATSPAATVTLCISAEASVRLTGTASAETINGSTSPDVIWGLAGNDTLNGSDGDDTFIGGLGNDSITGGAGLDTVDYSAVAGPITLNLTSGSVTVTGDGTDTLATIERVIATSSADSLLGSASADWLEGQADHDTLDGAAGDDHLYGQSGDDSLLGGIGDDVLEGGIGNDTLDGGTGIDALYAQAGDDQLVYDGLDAVIDGGEGLDTLRVSDATVNLVNGSHPKLQGIEVLDLTDSASTKLTLDLTAVRAMSGSSNQVLINAGANDTVGLTDYAQWSRSSSYDAGTGLTTKLYLQDGVLLKIVTPGNTSAVVTHYAMPTTSGSTYVGNDANNSLTGSSAGTANNDTLTPLAGADTVNGGDGEDTVDLTPQFRVDTISLDMGVDSQSNSYLVAIGDVNNDGFMDFAMRDANTTYTYGSQVNRYNNYYSNGNWSSASISLGSTPFGSGDVYVVYGAAGGLGSLSVSASEAPTGANAGYIKLTSSASAAEGFGNGLGSLGDFDGDGQSDLMVVAAGVNSYTYNMGDNVTAYVSSDSWTTSNEGRLYVFDGGNTVFTNRISGSVTQTTLSTSGTGAVGSIAQANALPSTSSGYALYDDARSYDPLYATDVPDAQTTYTYSTSATTADVVYTGGSSTSYLGNGWAPVSMGDLNGDGYDDFMAGSNGEIYFGRASMGAGFNASASNLGTAVDLGNFGRFANVGDIDGDGFNDMLVSDLNNTSNFIVYGGASAASWTAPASWVSGAGSNGAPRLTKVVSETGITLNGTYSALGDINGDGYDDLLLSAFGNSGDPNDFNAKNNGGLYVVFGQAGHWNDADLSLADLATNKLGFRITGAVDFDRAGEYSWTGVGDMNGDGLDDFMFQAPGDQEADNAGVSSLGSSYLIFGRQAGWQDISLLEMQDYGIQLLRTGNGYWTALGDVDGDGFDDVSLTNATSNLQIFYGDSFLTGDSNIAVKHIEGTQGESLTADALKTPSNAKGADRLIGNAGDDTLVGNGGADVLLGGAGDDLLQLGFVNNERGAIVDFFKIDGGSGIDTLEFTAAATLDFTAKRDDLVENVEIFKLGTGNQNITLNHLDVLSITGGTNTAISDPTYQKGHVLVIDGTGTNNTGDVVNLTGGWTNSSVGQVNVSGYTGQSFSVYQHGSDNIYVAIADSIDANSRHFS